MVVTIGFYVNLAKILNQPIFHQVSLKIVVVNNEKIPSNSPYQAVSWKLCKIAFSLDFIPILFSGFHVVLAVNGLRILKPIIWDFKYMKMSYAFLGAKITLHGIPESSSQMASRILTSVKDGDQSASLNQMLVEFDCLFQKPQELSLERTFDHRLYCCQILLYWW